MINGMLQSILHKAEHYLGKVIVGHIKSHAHECESCFTQLAKAQQTGEPVRKKIAIDRLLKSKSVKIAALIAELDSKVENLDEAIYQKLPGMNFKNDCDEPINTWAEPKDHHTPIGSAHIPYRQLCSYGLVRKARGWIVGRILEILFPCHPSNFLSPGRGLQVLCDHIKKSAWGNKKFNSRFIIFDVKDFYPSVRQNQEVVELLGLPEYLVRNDIFTSPTAPIALCGSLPHGVSKELFIGAARQGLPQGKATSSLVAGILYGRLLEQIAPAHRFFYYGDDGGIVCDEIDGETIAIALRAGLQAHPFGPFQPKHCGIFGFEKGFNFAGYHYQITSFKDRIRISPSLQSFKKLEGKIANIILTFPPAVWNEEIDRYVKHWLKAFPRWKETKNGMIKLQENIKTGRSLGMQKLNAKPKKPKVKITILKNSSGTNAGTALN